MKACSKCGETKDLGDFYKHPTASDGRFASCKACVLKDRRARYERDGDVLRERVREYQASHPEQVATRRAAWQKSDKGRSASRRRYLMTTYGLTIEQYDAMFSEQGNRCAICRSDYPGKTWSVDHDHTTGEVRGILCWHCNVGLGHFRDDVPNLMAAADYLLRSQGVTSDGAPSRVSR
jgi:hypothetical protein